MASSSGSFKSREDHRKQTQLVEARKAGLAAAEVEEDGKEINPHIPHYIVRAPWYSNADTRPGLKHQRKRKTTERLSSDKRSWYDRGGITGQADKYRNGACQNCGAMTHNAKSCVERPRKLGVKWTNKHIAPDEKIESFDQLTYDEKRDPYNGFDPDTYDLVVVERFEARDKARKMFKSNELDELGMVEDDEKLDESKQMEFATVEKRVRTTSGGSTGSVRNLRIREDTAKYLLNLDVNSAHYDPKTRSMREDPLPDMDPNEKFYAGDNQSRLSDQALEFKQVNIHAWEAFEKGNIDVHMQAAPSQAELLYRNFKINKEKLKSAVKETIVEKYGNAAANSTEEQLPKELLLGQSERVVEYDRAGRIIKGEEIALPKSKYDEDEYINNHTTVWGSWWNDHLWGYRCCKQVFRNSYCTGFAGIEAVEAAADFAKAY